MKKEQLIYCDGLSFAYDGQKVVSNISFSVHQGDYLYIVGKNGVGKSTLLKGLLKLKEPYESKFHMAPHLYNSIGYLPQQTVVQKHFPATAYEVVLSGCIGRLGMKPFFNRKEKNRAVTMMQKLGVDNLMKKSYKDLSGGQQQRVLLARALAASKGLIILDEPVSGLDPKATHDLYELINHINQDMNMTIIMVSHDINAALKYGTHILHLSPKESDSHFFGSMEAYKKSDACKVFTSEISSLTENKENSEGGTMHA